MKKLFITLMAVTSIAASVNAQDFGFKKSNVIVEGNFTLSSQNDKVSETKTTRLNFNPKIGYFFSDKLAAGVQFGIGSDKTKNTANNTTTETTISNFNVGVFGRYYFLELGKRFKLYSELGAAIGSEKTKRTNAADEKSSAFAINAGLGFNYFLTPRIAINYGLTDVISFVSSKPKGGKATSTFNANLNEFNNIFTASQIGLTFKF